MRRVISSIGLGILAIAVVAHAADDPAWRKAFDEVYTLKDGEIIRRIQPPYIAARKDFIQQAYTQRGWTVPGPRKASAPPDSLQLKWDPETRRAEMQDGYSAPWRFERQVVNLVGLRPEQISIPADMLHIDLPGDWIYRAGATVEAKLAGFQKVLEQSPAAFTFEKKRLKRDVIVIKGIFAPAEWPGGTINLNFDPGDENKPRQGHDIVYFVRIMTMKLGRPIVNEWAGSEKARLQFPGSKDFKVREVSGDAQEKRFREILKTMSEQMRVEVTPETREIETYVFAAGR